jgi:hypothetical protein
MKLRNVFASALLVLLAVPAVASAQPAYGSNPGYYGQPTQLPGGFHDRRGRMTLGISLGLGYMESESGPVDCGNCDYNPVTAGIAAHIGGMLNERLALMFEIQGNGQTLEQVGYDGTISLVQGAAMVAAQYWVTPQFWIKGGLGAAHLSYSYDDFYGNAGSEPIDDGIAILGAAGYELLSAQRYSIDLQGRLIMGNYDRLGDQITSGTIGVGINWF